MERWTRRKVLAALAAVPIATLPLPGPAAEEASTLRGRNRAAAQAAWPGQDVTYHHFLRLRGRARTIGGGGMRIDGDALGADIARARTSPVYIGIGGEDDSEVARAFHRAMTRTESTPPLQLHVVFVGDAQVGEVLRRHLGPVLAEFRVVTPPPAP